MPLIACAMATKCSKNFVAIASYAGRVRDSSRAMASMSRQNRPIQAVPSACSSRSPSDRFGLAAVENADVVQAEEATLKGVAALGVLAVDPPGEVEQQLVEDLLQEVDVALASLLAARSRRPAGPRGRGPAG